PEEMRIGHRDARDEAVVRLARGLRGLASRSAGSFFTAPGDVIGDIEEFAATRGAGVVVRGVLAPIGVESGHRRRGGGKVGSGRGGRKVGRGCGGGSRLPEGGSVVSGIAGAAAVLPAVRGGGVSPGSRSVRGAV